MRFSSGSDPDRDEHRHRAGTDHIDRRLADAHACGHEPHRHGGGGYAEISQHIESIGFDPAPGKRLHGLDPSSVGLNYGAHHVPNNSVRTEVRRTRWSFSEGLSRRICMS